RQCVRRTFRTQSFETDSVRHLIRFAIAARDAYFKAMPRKPIELPPAVARAFVNDMRAFPGREEPAQARRDRGRASFGRSSSTIAASCASPTSTRCFLQMKDHA